MGSDIGVMPSKAFLGRRTDAHPEKFFRGDQQQSLQDLLHAALGPPIRRLIDLHDERLSTKVLTPG